MTNIYTVLDTNGVVVYTVQVVSNNVWPAVAQGLAVGFLVFGFGVVLHMAKKTSSDF